jgi:hypothetical protein
MVRISSRAFFTISMAVSTIISLRESFSRANRKALVKIKFISIFSKALITRGGSNIKAIFACGVAGKTNMAFIKIIRRTSIKALLVLEKDKSGCKA